MSVNVYCLVLSSVKLAAVCVCVCVDKLIHSFICTYLLTYLLIFFLIHRTCTLAQVRGFVDGGNNTSSSDDALLNSTARLLTPTMTTVLVTQSTPLSSNPVYRIVYSNLLYFIVMFLVPLVMLLILNGELIRVLREKKAKRAKLLQGRSRPASISAAAGQQASPAADPRRSDRRQFIFTSSS